MVRPVPVAHTPVHGDHLVLNWQVRFAPGNVFDVDLKVPVEQDLSLARGVEPFPGLPERLAGRYPSLVPWLLALEFAAVAHGSGHLSADRAHCWDVPCRGPSPRPWADALSFFQVAQGYAPI